MFIERDISLYIIYLVNGNKTMRDQECEYSRESDWNPRMIKPFLFLRKDEIKIFNKKLSEYNII